MVDNRIDRIAKRALRAHRILRYAASVVAYDAVGSPNLDTEIIVNTPSTRSFAPTTDDLAKLSSSAVVAYAAGRARSVAKHIEIVEDDPETTVQSSDVEWVLSLLERSGSGETVTNVEIDRALVVANGLPRSVCSEEGVEAANVICHAVECMAAVVRHPEDRSAFLKWAADTAFVSDDHLDGSMMAEEAWEDYDRLLSEERL